jgi:hypothetical protein
VSWRCSIAPVAAREHVRVARRLQQLPRLCAAFAEGRLSYSKVRALSRVENIDREDELLALAENASAAQLEQIVRAYRGVVIRARSADAGRPERFVNWHHDDDGALVLRARLPAEEGAIVLAALEAAAASAEAPPPEAQNGASEERGASAEARLPVAERRADALVLMADTLLASAPTARPGADRFQIVLHVDPTTLSDGSDDGRCELTDGAPLSPDTARRLACDAAVVPLIERAGRPLSIGRKTRTVPPALRRALAGRDRGCRFLGRTIHHTVDAHHIQHWAHGGPTAIENLVLLCRYHHRLLHEGGARTTRPPRTHRSPTRLRTQRWRARHGPRHVRRRHDRLRAADRTTRHLTTRPHSGG